jgi:predicted NBD/HSP70 family sugar kinase
MMGTAPKGERGMNMAFSPPMKQAMSEEAALAGDAAAAAAAGHMLGAGRDLPGTVQASLEVELGGEVEPHLHATQPRVGEE